MGDSGRIALQFIRNLPLNDCFRDQHPAQIGPRLPVVNRNLLPQSGHPG
jgi:hypothetical protein